MSFNGRIEQYVIDNDKEFYEFTKKWVSEIEVKMRDKSDYHKYNGSL